MDIDIPTLIGNIISNLVWPVFAGAIVIMFLYSGIMFLTASGDPAKITKARTAAIFAVVGVAVGLLAYSAQGIIQGILGV